MKSTEKRATAIVFMIGACGLAVLWLIVAVAGRGLIEGTLEGRYLPGLGRSIRLHMTNNPEHGSVDYFADLATAAVGRALLLWAVFFGVLVAVQRTAGNVMTRFVTADADALTLAVTRFFVFGLLAFSVNIAAVERLAAQPNSMIHPPVFMGWFVDLVPISKETARWSAILLICTGSLASAGAFFRVTGPAAAILAVYVFGIPQFFGKISHGMHGPVWFSMILALSPAAATFSVDRLLGIAPKPGRSRAFGLPVRMIWFLFACVYFFPGFWKFVISGWDWALSDNLKFKMYSAWRGSDYLPGFRLDRYPILYQTSALVSMIWEIAFPLLIVFRRTRIPAVLMGVAFHIGVWEFMRIGPPIIMFGYVSFLDWGKLSAKLGHQDSSTDRKLPSKTMRIGGAAVCATVFIFGAALIDSWPFSVYPTHAGVRGPTYETVELVAAYPSGRTEAVDIRSVAPTDSQTLDFAVIASADIQQRNAYLTELARTWASRNDSSDVELRFYRSIKNLDPDNSGRPAVEKEIIFVVNPDTTGISAVP